MKINIMDFLRELVADLKMEIFVKTGMRVGLILLISWFIAKVLKRFLLRLEKQLIRKSEEGGEAPSESEKRIETIVRLIREGTMIALYLIVFLIILKEVGVEIGPIVASAGIVGIALGFGAQNLIRDIITGFFIILENQVRVGDVATVNGTEGLVEKINFRTIVLRDNSGVVHIFPNGTITTLSNSTNEWSGYLFNIGVAYKENTDYVIKIMAGVGEKLYSDERFGAFMLEIPEIFGVDKFEASAVIIKGRIRTKPNRQWDVGREYLRRIKIEFDKKHIEIPFPHQTVSFDQAGNPIPRLVKNKRKKTK